MKTGTFVDFVALLADAPLAFVAVDAALGTQPVKSMETLRGEVRRWCDEQQPRRFSDADCERLTGYLNRNFYRLSA